jgi:dTDP-4-dehydrorhamnose reductase
MRAFGPSLVIHCAARIRTRGTDSAEERRAMSRVNVLGSGVLARAAEELGARFVYVSTDFVFDGSRAGGMYSERDLACPLGYYPLTKYAGEGLVRAHPDSLVVRLSFNETWQYPKAFTDRFTSKLPVADAATQLCEAALTDLRGTVHIGGPRQSYYEFARSLGADVQPMTIADVHSADPLPVDTSLNTELWREHRRKQ